MKAIYVNKFPANTPPLKPEKPVETRPPIYSILKYLASWWVLMLIMLVTLIIFINCWSCSFRLVSFLYLVLLSTFIIHCIFVIIRP